MKTTFPKAVYLDLLEAEVFNALLADPQRLMNYIPAGHEDYIIVDEIQRVPELLNEIHRLIEGAHWKFILTGSNARKLRKGGQNLLAGRALTLFMYPLTAIELAEDFDLDSALRFGCLPSINQEEDPGKYLQSYIQIYLEQEIFQEGLTRNLAAFSRFLETASFSVGSVLNTSAVGREAAIERKVVENYFTILEDLLVGVKVPVFSKKAKRRLTVHPKFHFFDSGVYRAIRPAGPLDKPEEIEGIALENLVYQNLRAVNDNLDLGYKFYYYRTATGVEVDFVAYGERGLCAFEVKRSRRLSAEAVKGLKLFLKDYPEAKGYLIYGGKRAMREGKIEIIPVEEALVNLPKLLE